MFIPFINVNHDIIYKHHSMCVHYLFLVKYLVHTQRFLSWFYLFLLLIKLIFKGTVTAVKSTTIVAENAFLFFILVQLLN